MAFVFDTNFTPATGAEAYYRLKALLVGSGGYTVLDSGNGTTYGAGTDLITSATQLANTNAWYRIRAPSVGGLQRGFVVQRGTTNRDWRIKYSPSAGFTGGSPSATRVPSATDEVVLCGGGTDASPSFATILPTDGSYRGNAIADTTTRSFVLLTFLSTSGTPQGAFMLDVLADPTPGDPDPAVLYVSTSASGKQWRAQDATVDTQSESATTSPRAFFYSLTSANFLPLLGVIHGVYTISLAQVNQAVNPYSGRDESWPVSYARRAALPVASGYKGTSTLCQWCGTQRNTGDTYSTTAGSKDRIVVGDMTFPWDGSTPTV